MGEAGTLAAALGFLLLAMNAPSVRIRRAEIRRRIPQSGRPLGGVSPDVLRLRRQGRPGTGEFLAARAYAAAPRAFAPVLAGATLNLGLYGILRVNADLLPASDATIGLVALGIGTASALIGILYATTDNDLKVMLAHSSIENVGIIVAGTGAGMVFIAAGHPVLGSIAFVAALYHLTNHSLYKTLLFVGVGSVEARTGTRDMDRLGGLSK